jgi:hypothetical protein
MRRRNSREQAVISRRIYPASSRRNAFYDAITKLRERMELTPIDDALPGQPLRAFQLIRAIIDPRIPTPVGRP